MAETPEEKAAKEADEAKAQAAADQKEADEAADKALLADEEFDKDRALATIRAQRKVEREQKEELKELRAMKAAKEAADEKLAEADRTAEENLEASKAREAVLLDKLAAQEVRADFEREALSEEIGIDPEDLELAYLAAKEQGLLGEMDPDSGLVEGHDFDKLAEKYPAIFGGDGSSQSRTGDAGKTGRGKKSSVGDQFNKAVRDRIRG